MTAFKSDFLNILQERGFIHQCSDFEGLDALAAKGQATAYVGYDCTAPSLHIGNYLTMMMLHWLQQSGNKPITLMGGGTTMVGDPSGKDEWRAVRTIEEIEANKASIRGVFSKVRRYSAGPSDAGSRTSPATTESAPPAGSSASVGASPAPELAPMGALSGR